MVWKNESCNENSKMKTKTFWAYVFWAVIATVWATLCFIVPDFLDNPTDGVKSFMLQGIYIVALGIGTFWILYIAGLNKYVAAIFLPIYAIGGAGVAYFRVAQHATVTPMIVEVTLHTNLSEVQSVTSWQLYLYIFVNLLFAATLLYWRFKLQDPPKRWIQCILFVILLLCYYHYNTRLRISLAQRYPYNIVYSVHEYWKIERLRGQAREMPAINSTQDIDSLHVVLVLGEAMRADHVGLNGYERNTTPKLTQRTNLVSLPHIYSEYTHTSASVPHLLTMTDSLQPNIKHTTTSFISCFKYSGYHTAWISNQDYGHSYATFIQEADTIIFPNADKSVFVYSKWLDEELLPPMLESMSTTKNLSILHTIGSHWYYNNHVSDNLNIFQPTTDNRVVTNNTIEQIVNSYDNTVLYLDYFLDSLCTILTDKNALVIYLSDHGESLGEDGRYFHANDGEECTHPACVVWYSDKYAEMFPDKIKALHANYTKPYRTDFLFYSILSATGITPVDNRVELDIFTLSE